MPSFVFYYYYYFFELAAFFCGTLMIFSQFCCYRPAWIRILSLKSRLFYDACSSGLDSHNNVLTETKIFYIDTSI